MSQPTVGIGFSASTPAASTGDQICIPQSDGGTPRQLVNFVPQRATAALYGTVKLDDIQQQAHIYGEDTGSANAYAVTLSPAPTLVAGSIVVTKIANSNTGASTLAVNGGSAIAIKKNGATALASGDLPADQMAIFIYDGTNFQWVGSAGGGGAAITALTGDVTASGPGSAATTLADTAVTPGSYTNTSLTVDAKGRVTAASSGSSSGLTAPVEIDTDTPSTVGLIVKGALSASGANCSQSAVGSNASASTLAVSFPSDVKTGDCILVAVGADNASISTVSDSASNTYSLLATISVGTFILSIYAALNVTGGPTTVTVAFSSAGQVNVGIADYIGVVSASALDVDATQNTTNNTALTVGPLTTTVGNDILVSIFQALSVTSAAASGYTQQLTTTASGSSALTMVLSDTPASSAGAYSAAWTGSWSHLGIAGTVLGVLIALKTSGFNQASDLQQWKASDGTELSSVNGKGQIVLALTSGQPTNDAAEGAMAYDPATKTLYMVGSGGWQQYPGAPFTNPMTTEGDIIVGDAAGTPDRLAAGTDGYVLTSNGPGTAPSYQPASGGGGGGGSLEIATLDGSVDVASVTKLQVGNAVLKDNGSGVVTLGYACPALSSFSWVNQGSSTAVQGATNGPILLTIPQNSSLNWRGLFVAQPSTPYKVIALLRGAFPAMVNTMDVGIYFYDGTKLLGLEFLLQSSGILPRVEHITNVTTDSSTPKSGPSQFTAQPISPFASPLWVQLRNSGTTLYFDYSFDGVNFINFYSEAVGSFLTPTQIGFGGVCVLSTSGYYVINNLLAWRTEGNATL